MDKMERMIGFEMGYIGVRINVYKYYPEKSEITIKVGDIKKKINPFSTLCMYVRHTSEKFQILSFSLKDFGEIQENSFRFNFNNSGKILQIFNTIFNSSNNISEFGFKIQDCINEILKKQIISFVSDVDSLIIEDNADGENEVAVGS